MTTTPATNGPAAVRDDPRMRDAVLLRDREVAALLGVHPRTVHAWVATGHLPPPIRIGPAGRLVRWRLGDISRLIEERAAETHEDGAPTA